MNKEKIPMPFAVVSFVLVAFGGDNDFWNRPMNRFQRLINRAYVLFTSQPQTQESLFHVEIAPDASNTSASICICGHGFTSVTNVPLCGLTSLVRETRFYICSDDV